MTRGNLFVRYRNEDGSACELHWFGNHDFYESEVIPLIKEAISLTKTDLKDHKGGTSSTIVAKLLFTNLAIADEDEVFELGPVDDVCDYLYFIDVEVQEGCPFIMLRCFDVGCVRGKVTGERWPKALSTPQPFERLAEDFKLVLKEEVPL